jgi:hypothetical protein
LVEKHFDHIAVKPYTGWHTISGLPLKTINQESGRRCEMYAESKKKYTTYVGSWKK